MEQAAVERFRVLCTETGIAMTQQRLVIYEALSRLAHHPSPEDVYETVKHDMPAISLATVYKNIHLFIECGIFNEVSVHHGLLRVETNSNPHFHLVCKSCKSITDVPAGTMALVEDKDSRFNDFAAERYAIDVVGLCAACQQHPQ